VFWPDTLKIGDVWMDLAHVLASLDIHHGRADAFDDPSADTCQVTLLDVNKAFVRSFRMGEPMVVTMRDGAGPQVPRFTGRLTDANLADDQLTLIGTARLSTLGGYPVGSGNWPAEAWSARVARIFAEAGLSAFLEFQPDPLFDPLLAARDAATAGPTTLGDYLNFLAPMVGCAVVDRPNGNILVQAFGARVLTPAVALPPGLVAFSPPWTMVLPLGNVVTVRYQADQGASVTVRDDASVALYGELPSTVDTAFENVADATTRANERLGRGAYAHWNIHEAPLLEALDLKVGTPLILSGMPPASPYEPWTPILEGWTDSLAGDRWTMTLSLSDPALSGVSALPWNAVPVTPAYQWNTIDQAVQWQAALTLDDLTP